ncbi:MAG: aspartate carbamoyltransferase catalytic subunit [Legionellaceae bacterium]|nr:aspartate carbamoyltransferase catalytic subunit [Legionellaceae bacterium]
MKHFLEINQLSFDDATQLIQRALYFKQTSNYPSYAHHTVATLFYENSTRTRISFELAATHLNMHVINMNIQHSSEQKGEVMEDTIHTLAAMGVTIFVIRHSQNGLPQAMAGAFPAGVHIVNAGDGTHAHPTQALLDLMTIIEQKPNLDRLKIAIVGDLLHSRVANSLQNICALLGVGELVLVAPEIWLPRVVQYGRVTTSLRDGVTNADVVIGLRVQRERLSKGVHMDLRRYHRNYGITRESLADAKDDVMIMHPGPINRGVEMDSDVADGPRSFILKQVQNGVFMRMAILEALVSYCTSNGTLDKPRSNTSPSPPEPGQSDF